MTLSEAKDQLSEFGQRRIVRLGHETGLVKDGVDSAALIDARKLDESQALDDERASLVLAQDAIEGLEQPVAAKVIDEAELERTLSPGN